NGALRTFLGRFLHLFTHFLLDSGETAYPWLARLKRCRHCLDRRQSSSAVSEATKGHHIQRLALVHLHEVAILLTMLSNQRLRVFLRSGAEDLDQIAIGSLPGIPG